MNSAGKKITAPKQKPLPLVSLVRATEGIDDEPVSTRLLERGPSKMNCRPRLFMVARGVALPSEEIVSIMRMSRHQIAFTNYRHESILSRAIWDLEDAGYKFLDNGGGGFISDDPDNKKISVVCKSATGPANPKEVTKILRKGLPKEYEGYAIETKVIEQL